MYMYVCTCTCVCTMAGTMFAKQLSKLQQKTNKYSKFAHVFINVALITLIVCRMHPKLDYYFITSTSLVPVTVSTYILHHCT